MKDVSETAAQGTRPAPSDWKGPGKRVQVWTIFRRIVQTGVFALFLIPVLLSGWALFGMTVGGDTSLSTPAELPFYGSLSSSEIGGVSVVDPFGILQITAASRTFELDWLYFALPVFLVYGLIRGRVFCGWVCPVNFFLEGVDAVRKRLGISVKEQAVPRRAKIGIAIGVLVLSAIIGFPLFEAFSPISAINKGVLFGSTVGLVVLAGIVVLELFWGHRTWCRSLCPLGGFYEVLGRVGIMNVHFKRDLCTHCYACKRACIVDPEILDPILAEQAEVVKAGDCMLCGACVDICPTKALSIKPGR